MFIMFEAVHTIRIFIHFLRFPPGLWDHYDTTRVIGTAQQDIWDGPAANHDPASPTRGEDNSDPGENDFREKHPKILGNHWKNE